MSQDSLCLDKQVCFSLYSASNAMVRAYRPLLKNIDLTYLQYIVMMVLWEKDEISVGDLGDRVHLDSGTLTPLLKRLEAKGLISRNQSTKDERVRVLVLSDKGRALKSEAEGIPEQMLCKAKLPPEQLMALKQHCEDLLRTFES
jgi:DNA-binding MarR family transcriptional regulator